MLNRNTALIALLSGTILSAGASMARASNLDNIAVFATAPAGSTSPDSVSIDAAGASVYVEYGNGVDSTGIIPGNSTIVQYSRTGATLNTYSISGSVDGLKVDPTTGLVFALQNQDGNSTVSLINPATHTVSGPLSYAPPYVYGANSGRGYDDVAFLGSKVFLSYTNPTAAGDAVIQQLNQGHAPTGLLTTTNVLTAGQTGVPTPDADSLKATPDGRLVLTDGDGGRFSLVSNPGTAGQSVTNVAVTVGGAGVSGLDDVLFPTAVSGTLYFADPAGDRIDVAHLSGLNLADPLIAIGGLGIYLDDPTTGIATPFITAANLPGFGNVHGLDFVADAPEPASLALIGTAILGLAGLRRRRA